MKLFDILYEATETPNVLESPYNSLEKDGKGTAKALKSGKIPFLYDKWEKKGTGEYEAVDGDNPITLKFRSITVYGKVGRLRDPKKTKYSVYVEIMGQGIYGAVIDFGSVRGEGSVADTKVAASRKLARDWAKKVCGIELGEYDFKY